MAEYLKKAKPKAPQDRRKLEDTVRAMLDRIATGRDEAIRQYARDLDKWERDSFRATEDEIRSVAAKLPYFGGWA
jgi:sulfopropanediol 3-dehydrogenase